MIDEALKGEITARRYLSDRSTSGIVNIRAYQIPPAAHVKI